jgi:hypothetical protein
MNGNESPIAGTFARHRCRETPDRTTAPAGETFPEA